ncbi:MAG TPA: hypothetical protein VJ324_06450 [Candidatus Acidoferrum sp.]|jgi:hypothetical protein|nr:hypothetical protein [Candidatus Acidoferrum sp.]
MRYQRLLLGVCVFAAAGCHQHPLTDYRPLDQAGMFSSDIEQLKGLNVSDQEVAQVVKLKHAGVSDDTCVELVSTAHVHKHLFISAESAADLAGARFTESQILDIARADLLDAISIDAVTLKLIGLSDTTVQLVLQRHLDGKPVMASAEISRLKNTGLTERQILDRIHAGMTDEQAEKEIKARESARNHKDTSFVRVRGRKPR